ncbi:hypothetical protein E2R55_00595 [Vibrio vulnificus]|nr:hypothetical protein E2R55_00595 [Vibrio vulnificus]
MIEMEGRDSCGESASKGDPTGAKSAEEAPGPPAERECLEWKSTFKLQTQKSIELVYSFACIISFNLTNSGIV